MVRLKTKMNFAKRDKAAHQKPRTDQKSERKGHLENDHGVAQPTVAETTADSLPAVTQRIVQVAARRVQRRYQAKHQRRRHRHPESKKQNHDVQADRCFGRNYFLRNERDQRFESAPRQKCAKGCSPGRQNEALDEQLTHGPPTASTQRSANGELFLAGGGTCQQQVGYIAAANK